MIDVANFGDIIRLSDMECCAFIRHLVIEFANNGKTLLKFPKMGCFQFKISTFGNFWTCLKLPIPGLETYLGSEHAVDSDILIANVKYSSK